MKLSWNVAQYGPDDKFTRDCFVASTCTTSNMVRLDLVNQYITQRPGVYDWSDADRRVNQVVAFGMKVCAMIPYWTPEHGKRQVADLKAVANHVAFVRALVARYGNKILAYELGNEPNIKSVNPDGAKPEFQAKIAVAVKKALPAGALVCSPGMSPSYSSNGSLSPYDYLERMWPKCPGVFNRVGIHPYGREQDAGQSWSTLGMMPKIYNNITHLPFFCTEYNAGGPIPSTNATWVHDTLPWLDNLKDPKGHSMVSEVFIYAMSDPGTDGNPFIVLGCIDENNNARPVLGVIQDWVRANPG